MSHEDITILPCGASYCVREMIEGCFSCLEQMEHEEMRAEAELQDELNGRYAHG